MAVDFPGQVWLIGGTQESRELAVALAEASLPCQITVTSESARQLYPAALQGQIQVTRLAASSLPAFLQQHQIQAVLDASHPFAIDVSQLAITAATELAIPYLRYERPALAAPDHSDLPSFPALLQGDYLTGQRVLLTVGYRPLALFQPWQERATLFARILPSVQALEAALEAGFSSDRLIALRPPVSLELERAIWQQWQIALVVTKASGVPGGEGTKRQLAAELGVQLLTIARPDLAYPQQTSDIRTAIAFCHRHLGQS